jgi:hypothetical protein
LPGHGGVGQDRHRRVLLEDGRQALGDDVAGDLF